MDSSPENPFNLEDTGREEGGGMSIPGRGTNTARLPVKRDDKARIALVVWCP